MTPDIERLASNMRRRKLHGHRLYRVLLMPLMQTGDLHEGYQHLAWLLREGYLATIMTLNSDTQIENILYSAGITATILEIGKDTIHSIADALEDPPPGICIIKIHHHYTASTQLANNPSLLPDELHASLKIYLQNALVIVGSAHQDSTIVQILRSTTIKSIYYILSQPPPHNDVLEEIRREKKREIFSICDPYGTFTPFLVKIVSLIKKSLPASLSPIQADDRGPIHQHAKLLEHRAHVEQHGQKPSIQPNGYTPTGQKLVASHTARQKSKITADIFIGYSRRDKKFLNELRTHLAQYVRSGAINAWDDSMILPGAKWYEDIINALQSAKIAILLVSADFLASDFVARKEISPLLKSAEQEGLKILSVILRPCAFLDTELAQFQAANTPSSPLSSMRPGERDEVWRGVAARVKKLL